MIEERTFSAIIDTVVARALRRDRRADAISYARQTMRECQVLALFDQDLVEDRLTTNAQPYIWTIPLEFRMMRIASYPVQEGCYEEIYPKFKAPGRGQQDEDYFYYRAADYYVFAGLDSGSNIDVAYYSYFKPLVYFEEALRPARFDLETQQWVYLTAVTDLEKEAARALVTNWMVFNWFDLIVEGTLAKLYKTVSDERQAVTYSLYKSYQKDLLAGEAHGALGQP